jgi:hypothetical protein
VRYQFSDAVFTREIFSSFPDQVIVVRLTCDKPGRLSFSARLSSKLRNRTESLAANHIALKGKCPKHVDPNYLNTRKPILYDEDPRGEGMTFETHFQIVADGGEVEATIGRARQARAQRDLVLSAATSFNGFDKSPGREGKIPPLPHSNICSPQSGRTILNFWRHTFRITRDCFAGSSWTSVRTQRPPHCRPTSESGSFMKAMIRNWRRCCFNMAATC